ncbi:enoyl-CoA hydratase-related protein [Blastococcus sp. SYSU DS0533]
MSGQSSVVTEVQGRVLVVRIERDAKRNAIDGSVAHGLSEAFDLLEDDPDLWAGVLTGTPLVFSAGTDLGEGASPATERGGEYGLVRRRRSTPLIAAVEGPAFGGGFELALACDLVVASDSARFALPETRRGLVASSGALFRARRALPRAVATELLVAGTELDAARAHALGLVNRVVPAGQAAAEALALAAAICRSSPLAVRETMGALATLDEEGDRAGWAASDAALARVHRSADAREGIAAFLGRRVPEWRGR